MSSDSVDGNQQPWRPKQKKTGFNGINPQKQMSNNHNKRVFSNNVLLVASSSSQIVWKRVPPKPHGKHHQFLHRNCQPNDLWTTEKAPEGQASVLQEGIIRAVLRYVQPEQWLNGWGEMLLFGTGIWDRYACHMANERYSRVVFFAGKALQYCNVCQVMGYNTMQRNAIQCSVT